MGYRRYQQLQHSSCCQPSAGLDLSPPQLSSTITEWRTIHSTHKGAGLATRVGRHCHHIAVQVLEFGHQVLEGVGWVGGGITVRMVRSSAGTRKEWPGR